MVAFLSILGFVDGILHTLLRLRGVLNMLSALAPCVMRHPDMKHRMEDFTMRLVFPEFTAP
jgi:hypothetical protein